MKEVDIFITFQSQGIPLNYNGEKTPTQERNIDITDDNIVGIASEGGDGDEGGQVAKEAVGEDIGGVINENIGQVAEEAIGEDIRESCGEDVGQFAEEPAGESDTMLNEDSFRSFKTDDSDLEDNTDHVEAFSCDVNNPIMEGKEITLSKIHGHWEFSYQRIFDFKEKIVRRNPGSHVEVKLQVINGEHHFQRVFLAFGQCIQGFLNGCRPYIALHGCHLKEKYRGVLISATSIDGNKSIFLVAFGVVESENSNSWEWFLHGLKAAIGESEGLVFSSDRQKGLDEAVQVVYPRVEYKECMRHLYGNFKTKFRGDCYRDNLWAAAKAYTPYVYETSIAKMYEANLMAIEYLRQNHSYLWSRSKFETIAKCDYLTNNISESFNAWISNDRYRPLIDMLDTIRQKIMLKMEERRNRSRKWDHEIIPKVLKYVNNLSKGLDQYKVLWSDEFSAEVIGPLSRFEDHLKQRINSLQNHLKQGINTLKHQFKQGISTMKHHLKQGIRTLNHHLKQVLAVAQGFKNSTLNCPVDILRLLALASILGHNARTGTCMVSGVRTTRKFSVGSAADLADSPTRSTQAYVGKKSKLR
uniref:MULE transposase domain-containing protein n=1 Tax=Ananas comosus var. bracteatus TaxID=296719 RepID=A0A6V7NFK4_ANACO|nr:unnamed protein product [Ananas comosus var. bracteatus]